MEKHGILINDLHAFVTEHLSSQQLKANVHFTAEWSRRLAEPVAKAISVALAARR